MSSLTETSPLLKMSGKRMFEDGDYQSRETARPFKRSYASVTRNFPSNCGPLSPNREQGSQDLSVGEKSSNLGRDGIVIAAKPLRVFAAPDANFEYLNPSATDDRKVDNVKQIFMGKDEEKLEPAVAPGKAQSEKEARDDALPPGIAALANLKASAHSLKFARKYPPPKIRKGVTVVRSFPPNCGEHCVSFSKIAMESGRPNSEMKPCKAITEASDKSIEDDDQDFLIIGEQLNSVCNENVVKDQYEPGPVTENTPSKHVEEPYRCDSDRKEDAMDDTEICIITPSEWDQLQSRFKRENISKKDMRDESLVKEVGKISEEYSMEGFADTDTKVENYDEESNAKELKNLCIVQYDADKAVVALNEVKKALKLFGELYTKLYQEYKAESKGRRVTKQMHIEAAILLRNQQKWVNVQPIFGHVPGVEVGDEFQFRAQLVMVGLHHQFIYGISYVTVNGKKYANSVVDSGRYENKVLSRDIIVYSGQGGNPRLQNLAEKSEDQKLEGANLALKHSKDANLPVRVIRKTCLRNRRYMYIYEGLYTVTNYWQERTQTDKLAFMFEMVRISGQSDGSYQQIKESRTSTGYLEQSDPAAAIDLSQGKEKTPIRIVNAMSNEKPQPFTYITEMKYPDWYHISEPCGCDCIDGCSDSKPCYCAYKNGGEIPFNEEGSIIKAKRLVHECGPSCKCPPSCQNRVSQGGPRFQLEVFKTKSTGWGVRSQEDIPSGSFICEYIGEVLPDKEAEKRINDEYLFDLDDCDGFTIDAAQYGNVGRFINHGCSPNLYAQNVLYDNDDEKLPHIMLFATKKIPALQELTYNYNYKIDRVCDASGNIKKKVCHCGSRKCTGRMY